MQVDSGSGAAWVYEIPFQYAWAAAEAVEMRFNPEDAAAVIESELSSVCRVRIDLAAPARRGRAARVHAWQLRASCPFCDAGKDQTLCGDDWIDVNEWDEDLEADLRNDGAPRSGTYMGIRVMYELGGIEKSLDRMFFANAMGSWGLSACAEDGLNAADEGPWELMATASGVPSKSTVNAYGVSLAEVLAALDEANRGESAFSGQGCKMIAREFGVEGYFGGLCRCSHCGNVFAVAYRDPHDDTKEGRYRLMPEIIDAIEGLVAKNGCISAGDDEEPVIPGHAPTMSVAVTRDASRLALRANIAGCAHELIFDTAAGSFLLDGEPYVTDEPVPHLQINGLRSHPLVLDCLSLMPGLVLELLEMLPSLPEGVDVSPATLQEHGRGINLLVAANRFVGYPVAFYNEMALSATGQSSTGGLELVYPLKTGLPRECAEVEALYEQMGLPEGEQLKRCLSERPQLLIDIRRKPDLPFVSADVLARFFQLPRIDFCMRILSFYPQSAAGWRRLVEVKGEEAVFSYIEEQAKRPNVLSSLPEDERFCEATALLDALCDRVTDEQLASVRMERLCDDLERLMEA